jgi:hypothetical protein
MQVFLDRRQPNIHNRHVHANDQRAHAANRKDEVRIGGTLAGSSAAPLAAVAAENYPISVFSNVSPRDLSFRRGILFR